MKYSDDYNLSYKDLQAITEGGFDYGAIAASKFQSPAWTDFSASASWMASNTNPTLGNGTMTAKYCRIGRLVYYSVRMLLGSTTNAGDGVYSFSLPISAESFS